MKRVLFLACFLMTCVFAFSQTFYKITANNVVVRSGPGKNYSALENPYGNGACRIDKGMLVVATGQVCNGYICVESTSLRFDWGEGWISLQFAKKAIKCPVCKGRGNNGRKCKSCNGVGYGSCCGYTGMQACPKCGYSGYY